MGLMQIMPATGQNFASATISGTTRMTRTTTFWLVRPISANCSIGIGSPGVFAAYNAGPTRYGEHLEQVSSLPDETRAYVAKVANLLAIELPPRWTSSGQSSAAATLFVTRSDLMKTRDRLLALIPSSGVTTAISAPDVSRMALGLLACSSLDRIGNIAMTKYAGSQVLACVTGQVARADSGRAMPSARALLVASLLTEPPFGCLGPSGNDRYRNARSLGSSGGFAS